MNRRHFIGLLGGAATTWPLAARAQQTDAGGRFPRRCNGPRIRRAGGWISARPPAKPASARASNVAIEYRWAEDQFDRLPALAADLVQRQVSVIARCDRLRGRGGEGGDRDNPDRLPGRVRSGRRRACRQPEPARRQHHRRDHVEPGAGAEAAGAAARAGAERHRHCRCSSTRPIPQCRNQYESFANGGPRARACSFMSCTRAAERDFDAVFATLAQLRPSGLVISARSILSTAGAISSARWRPAMRVPAIFQYREFAAAGGLMSYGGSTTDAVPSWSASTPAAFSRARSPPTCRCSSPPKSS